MAQRASVEWLFCQKNEISSVGVLELCLRLGGASIRVELTGILPTQLECERNTHFTKKHIITHSYAVVSQIRIGGARVLHCEVRAILFEFSITMTSMSVC